LIDMSGKTLKFQVNLHLLRLHMALEEYIITNLAIIDLLIFLDLS
jgi:hypothetical protein